MAFLPMDIQVNVMQASNVAELAANEREEPKRAKSERSQKWVQKRQEEENTSDEAGKREGNKPVDEDEEGNQPDIGGGSDNTAQDVEDEDNQPSGRHSEPDKGTHLDLTT